MRRLALVRLINMPNAAPVEVVLTKMVVPDWVKLIRVRTNINAFPEYTELLFETTTSCLYLTPENCEPPILYIDTEGNIDWHSCDGEDLFNGSQACQLPKGA